MHHIDFDQVQDSTEDSIARRLRPAYVVEAKAESTYTLGEELISWLGKLVLDRRWSWTVWAVLHDA